VCLYAVYAQPDNNGGFGSRYTFTKSHYMSVLTHPVTHSQHLKAETLQINRPRYTCNGDARGGGLGLRIRAGGEGLGSVT
jgi:hypothetical protein